MVGKPRPLPRLIHRRLVIDHQQNARDAEGQTVQTWPPQSQRRRRLDGVQVRSRGQNVQKEVSEHRLRLGPVGGRFAIADQRFAKLARRGPQISRKVPDGPGIADAALRGFVGPAGFGRLSDSFVTLPPTTGACGTA